MLRKITVPLFALVSLLSTANAMAGESVDAFIDACQAALSAPASITAKVSCRTYAGDQLLPTRFTGVVTWSSGRNPFLLMTMVREDASPDGGAIVSRPILVAGRDDYVSVADGVNKVYYEERMGRTGAHLISSRLDVTFLVLRFPHLLDAFRSRPGVVGDEIFNRVKARRMVVDDRSCHLELVVDAATGLPLRIDRTAIDPSGRSPRTVLELSEYRVSSLPPPDALFNVNELFSFPRKRYDPTGLFSAGAAPYFTASMLDGSRMQSPDYAGRWVFICFHSECDSIRALGVTNFERAGDLVRSRGGEFIDAYPSSVLESSGASCVYRPKSAVNAESLFAKFDIVKVGLPTVVVIGPDGAVREMLIGYIPALSEREIEGLINECLPVKSESR